MSGCELRECGRFWGGAAGWRGSDQQLDGEERLLSVAMLLPLVVLILLILISFHNSSAFSILSTSSSVSWIHRSNSFIPNGCPSRRPVVLHSEGSNKKRKRRRRPTEEETDRLNDDDDLPSFEMMDEAPAVVDKPSELFLATENVQIAKERMDLIKGNGSSSPVVDNIKDLIASRDTSLESTFEFEPVANPLPRLGRTNKSIPNDTSTATTDFSTRTDDGISGVGKKRARDMARQAAAVAAAQKEKANEKNFLSTLPFIGKMMEEKQTPVKVCFYFLKFVRVFSFCYSIA